MWIESGAHTAPQFSLDLFFFWWLLTRRSRENGLKLIQAELNLEHFDGFY